MENKKINFWIYAIVIAFIVSLDFTSKKWIQNNIDLYARINVFKDIFYITHVSNTGAAFGMFSNFQGYQRWFLSFLSISVSIWLLFSLVKENKNIIRLAYSLIIGGALGNFIDRVSTGEVIDFIQVNMGIFYFPAFNIADLFISIGAALFISGYLFESKDTK